jgi:two-component system NarL family sensor kinase
LRDATERLGEAIGEVRSLSHDLRSSLLDTLGLAAAIGQLAAEFEQRSGLTVTYNDNLNSTVNWSMAPRSRCSASCRKA